MIIYVFIGLMSSYLSPQFTYMVFNILICILHLLRVYYELCDQLPVGLIAQLVEHCTGIAEVMGSNPVQARIFFRLQLPKLCV